MEVIPLFTASLQVGLKAFDYFGKDKQKKGDFQSNLERAESMLRETEPLIRKMKKVEGTSKLGEFERLIQTVQEGNQLILEIRRSDRDQKKYGNKVEEWMESFRDSILIAMLQLHSSTATGVEQIRQHLLPKHQAPQIIHFHLHHHHQLPFPASQQLSLSLMKDENYNNTIRQFIDGFSMSGGLESLLRKRGFPPVSTDKTKDAKRFNQESIPEASALSRCITHLHPKARLPPIRFYPPIDPPGSKTRLSPICSFSPIDPLHRSFPHINPSSPKAPLPPICSFPPVDPHCPKASLPPICSFPPIDPSCSKAHLPLIRSFPSIDSSHPKARLPPICSFSLVDPPPPIRSFPPIDPPCPNALLPPLPPLPSIAPPCPNAPLPPLPPLPSIAPLQLPIKRDDKIKCLVEKFKHLNMNLISDTP